jgi:prepilin-type processing-associated H-X9-DG protein
MANLRALTIAWNMYADDQNERIPCADIMFSHGSPGFPGSECFGIGWYEWPHVWKPQCTVITNPASPSYFYGDQLQNVTEEDWKHCISDGTLWKYIEDYRIYRCPAGEKDAYVTYAIAHSMNAWCWDQLPFGVGSCAADEVRLRSQIRKPAERMVFADQGYQSNGAFAVFYDRESFWDAPPVVYHGYGMPVSFADGHCEFHKWVDQRTATYYWGNPVSQACNQDLYWLQKVIWGQLGYVHSCPPEF